MNSPASLVEEGYIALIQRFAKFIPDTQLLLENLKIRKNSTEVSLDEQEVFQHLCDYKNECSFYLSKTSEMNVYESVAFISFVVKGMDIRKGLFLV